MNIVAPEWSLKNQRCPCALCDGQGELILLSCPNCQAVILECGEVGTIFLSAHNLNEGQLPFGQMDNYFCPNCGATKLADFGLAASTEIQRAGFGTGEYC